MAVLLFDPGKKRIKSEANFASLMPIRGYQTNHRSINHLALSRPIARHLPISKKMGTIHKSQPQFVAGLVVIEVLSVAVIGNGVMFSGILAVM